MSLRPRLLTKIGVGLAAIAVAAVVPVAEHVGLGAPGTSGGGAVSTQAGNNLSNPALFSEGIGITGLADTTADAGLLPWQQAWTGLRVPAPTNPTLTTAADGTYTDTSGAKYYLQGTLGSSWQASWRDARDSSPVQTDVTWGSSIVGALASGQGSSWSVSSTVPVEVSMTGVNAMGGDAVYFPTHALYGSGSGEVFGTTGEPVSAAGEHPSVFSEAAYLTIQKLDPDGNPLGDPIHTLTTWSRANLGPGDGPLTAEVDASGRIVYAYNWIAAQDNLTPGVYRLTFAIVTNPSDPALDPPMLGNAQIAGVMVPSSDPAAPGSPANCGAPVQVGSGIIPLTCGTNSRGSFSSVDITLGSSSGGSSGGPGSADHLSISSGPVSTSAETTAPPILVSILDAAGNVAATDNDTEVDLSLVSPPVGVVLTCTDPATLQATASGGVATFNGCAVNEPGTYTLKASVPATSPGQPAGNKAAETSWVVESGADQGGRSTPGFVVTAQNPGTSSAASSIRLSLMARIEPSTVANPSCRPKDLNLQCSGTLSLLIPGAGGFAVNNLELHRLAVGDTGCGGDCGDAEAATTPPASPQAVRAQVNGLATVTSPGTLDIAVGAQVQLHMTLTDNGTAPYVDQIDIVINRYTEPSKPLLYDTGPQTILQVEIRAITTRVRRPSSVAPTSSTSTSTPAGEAPAGTAPTAPGTKAASRAAAALVTKHRALAELNRAISTTNTSLHKFHTASLRALRQHLPLRAKLAANVRRLEIRLHSLLHRRQALVVSLVKLRS